MLHKYFLIIVLTLISQRFCLAQSKKVNNWVFGYYAGLDFNQPSPTPFESPLGQVNSSSCISDDAGNLLFYTDGSRVWNRLHQIMPNGAYLNAHDGNISQQVIIVPKPKSTNQYYIFTISDFSLTPDYELSNNLLYHEVSFKANPYGEVVSKNNILSQEILLLVKITAVHHANGEHIWILTQGALTGKFYAYLITEHGISTPVISNETTGASNFGSGPMKFSPDGTKLAVSNSFRGILLYHFNKETGLLSNSIFINTPDLFMYGVEFSTNSKMIYVATRAGACFPGTSYLKQYDCSIWDASKINASSLIVASGADNYGMLQLAPDGKIYMGGRTSDCETNSYLDIIEYPNIKGVNCKFIKNGKYLGGKTTW